MTQLAARTTRTPNGQAKTLLDEREVRRIAFEVQQDPHGLRNVVAFYLSFYCALRACEIARLDWRQNVLDAKGEIGKRLRIGGNVAKRGNGGELDIPTPLRNALLLLRQERPNDRFVFHPLDDRNARRTYENQTALTPNAVVQFFGRLYEKYGYEGMSSHSGRRSAVTVFARKSAKTGEHSLIDVMKFARHKDPATTMTYIEPNEERGALVEGLWGAHDIRSARKVARRETRREAAYA